MSSKGYSPQEREEIRNKLLECASRLYAKNGIKNTRLQEILDCVHISKPFFYKFFPSVQVFIIHVLNYQWNHISNIITTIKEENTDWQQQARTLFNILIHHNEHKILIMTQEEQVWVYNRLPEGERDTFMLQQINFFNYVLAWWEIPKEYCDAKTFGNLVISTIVMHNSARESLPFVYIEAIEQSANAQAESIIQFLKQGRNKKKEN